MHDHAHASHKSLRSAFFINLAFAVIELVGGMYTNSMAILSDALHDLGDSLSLGIAWYFEKLSKRGRSKTFTYGLKRLSLLGALLNALILVAGTVVILYHAIPRLFQPQAPDIQGMMWLAIAGVIFNGWAIFKIRSGKSLNEQLVQMHLWEDVLGWLAVLIGAIVMRFIDAPFIDPLLSIGIAIFLLYNVYGKLKATLRVLLQGTPEHVDVKAIEKEIVALPEVIEVHDCHVWSMDGDYIVLTLHLVLSQDHSLQTQSIIKGKVRSIASKYKIDHATIEFEAEDEFCALHDC